MKVYFTASQRGKKYFKNYYIRIFKTIEKLGYQNINDDVLSISYKKFYRNLELGGPQKHIELYKQKISNIRQADICVFECSLHSLSIGFIIEKALDANKPTIVLYFNENVPYFLTGIQDKKLIIKNYNDKNLDKVLKESLQQAKQFRDKRFNFFLNPRLLNYLSKESKRLRITKSTFIRNLIIDYKNHSKKHL